MKFGVSWRVKGVRPEARESAEQAARRAGMSLGDWLNSAITLQAGQTGVQAPPLADSGFHGGNVAAADPGPEAYAPKRSRYEPDPSAVPEAAPEIPSAQLPPTIERAVSEIAARQRTLQAKPPRRQPPAEPPAPTPYLSALEEQLRNLTNQIETLRKPDVEAAINALRAELGEIGRTLSDAMPRRALEAIEQQIRGLDRRIADSRQAGVDAAALSGIEHGLAEIRDAMHGLMPAENLIGYTEAVANLAHKIELIVAQNDPATMAQLEHSISTLREMSNHIASNETVRALSAQVQALAEKIDAMAYTAVGSSDSAFGHLEQRIAVLTDMLAQRAHDVELPARLEALLQSLADKVDQLQSAHDGGGGDAIAHLEDRIVHLVEKLDASDARLGQLEGIERGLSDLLIHIEELRANAAAGGLRAQDVAGVDDLKHDIARTQDALEAVHGTLGHVVDRLATIEKDIREQARPQVAADSAAALVEPASIADAPPLAPAQPAPRRMSTATSLPLASELPDNQPLEPGSGRPPSKADAAARIAASEAALSETPPAAPSGGKSSFIAAARRAAQAAGQQPRPLRTEAVAAYEAETGSLRDKVMKRVKSLFVAASIIAVVVGSVQMASRVFNFGSSITKLVQTPGPAPDTENSAAKTPEPDTTESIAAQPAAPSNQSATGMLPPASGSSEIASNLPPTLGAPPQTVPSLFGPPVFGAKEEVTGSIPQAAPQPAPAAPSPPLAPPSADRLPTGIGGPKLRSAALNGDPAAAYAVALRYAEGRGVPVDMDEAARWFELAASKGLAPAQFRYASLLEKGVGVKKDLAQARRLYLAAAEKGNSKAMHNLAVLYAEGIDGKPDYATAVQWFRKAAQHGVADSQYNLGVLCARGLGTDKSFAEAYKWFALAAAQGDNEAAKKRDEVASHLDAAALAAAEQAVKSFVAEPQPQDAITVREPAGGWDRAASAPVRANPRPSGPLALGSFQVGKR